ncbi:MAG: lipid-A-disaccharide synthase [Pseudomonadota bacterium]
MRIGIVAGEASGDLLGAGLIEAVRAGIPDARFEGVAGPRMQAAGCDVWQDAELLAVMGLIEPLKVLPSLLRLRRGLVERWTESPPDVFVGIDAPEFNLGLEFRLRERGIRTIQYVSPQVWAWRQKRVQKIGRAVDKVLCLLPFEKAFYDQHGVPADIVGHPLADAMPAKPDRTEARGELELGDGPVLAILPGSRAGEVARLGPVFAEAAALLSRRNADLQFVAPMANAHARRVFTDACRDTADGIDIRLLDGDAPSAITAADVVLLASGTASLQTALLQRPMVSAYRVAPMTYYLARLFRLLKVPHFTMPNLLTPEPLVPEFLQNAGTPEVLASAVQDLLDDAPRRVRIEAEFSRLRGKLALNANERAADAVIAMAEGRP